MIWGKSPERQVVMPAGAFKFLKNDIQQKKLDKRPELWVVMPAGVFNFLKKDSRQNDLGQKPRTTGCHAHRGLSISQK